MISILQKNKNKKARHPIDPIVGNGKPTGQYAVVYA